MFVAGAPVSLEKLLFYVYVTQDLAYAIMYETNILLGLAFNMTNRLMLLFTLFLVLSRSIMNSHPLASFV